MSAQAACPLCGLDSVSPQVNPTNGFPVYYMDKTGLALELCLDGDGTFGPCVFDPPDPTNPWSVQTGFGDEAFWYVCDAVIPLPNGGNALLVQAVEAAYSNFAQDGDQFAFARLRIRIDAPVSGSYLVIFPYGEREFANVPAGVNSINETLDIGSFSPVFTAALNGIIGPFVVSETFQKGVDTYVGNPQIEQRVTGSPFGTNYFRVEGPVGAFPNPILDPGGIPTGSYVQTDLFTLAGKVFQGTLPTGIQVSSATYARAVTGETSLTVHAHSAAGAKLTLDLDGTEHVMHANGTGGFFVALSLPAGQALPTLLTVTATEPGALPSAILITDIHPVVRQAQPLYDVGAGTLLISATSSDQTAGCTLSADGYGDLIGGMLSIPDVQMPPPVVSVSSCFGGTDIEEVKVVNVSGNNPPVAVADFGTTDNTVTPMATAISVLANDFDPDRLDFIDPTSVVVVAGPGNGTAVPNVLGNVIYTPDVGFNGTDSFSYVMRDNHGAFSSPGVVTIDVLGFNLPPFAVDDAVTTFIDQPITIFVLDNDFDIQGNNTIDATSVALVALPAFGSATVDPFNGHIDYTPVLGFSGTDFFLYTVADVLSAVSDPGIVVVTVTTPIVEIVDLQAAQYRTGKSEWKVQGQVSPPVPGTTVTLTILRTDGTSEVLAVVPEDPTDGTFKFRKRGSSVTASLGDLLEAKTSNGASQIIPISVSN